MNVWLVGATVLLAGLLPCLWVLMRESPVDGLVALQTAGATTTLVLVLLFEGYHRSAYTVLPLALSILGLASVLLFARFLARWLR